MGQGDDDGLNGGNGNDTLDGGFGDDMPEVAFESEAKILSSAVVRLQGKVNSAEILKANDAALKIAGLTASYHAGSSTLLIKGKGTFAQYEDVPDLSGAGLLFKDLSFSSVRDGTLLQAEGTNFQLHVHTSRDSLTESDFLHA